MSWDERIAAEFEPYSGELSRQHSLPELIAAFIQEQKQSWPLLRNGSDTLEKAEIRRLDIPGAVPSFVYVQYNPGRIRSTAAAVDKTSVASRPCFLCVENLPPEEKSIAYGSDLVITCNPFPVLPNHLSILERRHVPQQIESRLESMLALAHDLGPEYFVLYNGPRCGASAPDHFHFQACARSNLPIEEDLRRSQARPGEPIQEMKPGLRARLITEGREHLREDGWFPRGAIKTDAPTPTDSVASIVLATGSRGTVVVRSAGPRALASELSRVVEALRLQTGKDDEPMINIVAVFEDGEWKVFLFPRARHRPACFYAEGNERLLVSPGAIDMAGVIVMPDREEFLRIAPEQIRRIFSEVSLDLSSIQQAATGDRTVAP
ncbi:MAG TPA: DUF4922 domain-containing protein [Blastocatellia bacterium]